MTQIVGVPVEQFWHRVPGGTARATLETIRASVARPDLELLGVAAWHRPSHRGRTEGLLPVRFLPMHRATLYRQWIRGAPPRLEQVLGRLDVVWAAATVPPTTDRPLVVTVHDLDFLAHPERLSRRGRRFFPKVWDAVGERARIIVCPSAAVADDCASRGVDRSRLRVVPWGVAPPTITDSGARGYRQRLGLPERFALWVGTLEPRKNLPGLVEAMGRVPGIDLVIAGPAGWNLNGDDVLAPLEGRVHRVGRVNDDTLHALYRSASVFVFPSLSEGFGLPVLEAMAHGTPVVTSATGATGEVAEGAALLVDPRDPAAIADAVTAVLDGGPEIEALVAAGRRRAAELTWAATAQGYREVFADAAAEAG
ncbi:MAG: glycosyltransferase family 4 protein [Acidimicrobiales bacterium]